MRKISFKVSEDIYQRLEGFAIKKNMSRSEAIRLAIDRLLGRKFNGPITAPQISGRGRGITMTIPPDQLERLDKFSDDHGLTRSEAIRLAIEMLLEEETESDILPRLTVEKIRL